MSNERADLIAQKNQLTLDILDIKQQLKQYPARNEWRMRTEKALNHKSRQVLQIDTELARLKALDKEKQNRVFSALLAVARAADALTQLVEAGPSELGNAADDVDDALQELDDVMPTWKEKKDATC